MSNSPVPAVHSLPPEILVQIFTLAAPSTQTKYEISWEVTVSHVCKHWREVALSTPLLWTDIGIYSIRCIDRVSSYFQRSDRCPVDLWFDVWQADKKIGHPGWLDPIIDVAVRDVTRWRTLLVFAHRKSTTNSLLSKIAELTAPMLQRIRLVDDGEESGESVVPWDGGILAGGAPNLLSVQMDRASFLPLLANVTTLHLRSTSVPTFKLNSAVVSALAEVCHSLSVLSIHGCFNGGGSEWTVNSPPKVTMKSLRCFWFSSNTEDTSAAYFLMFVSLPQLTSLWLDLAYYHLPVLHLLCCHPFRPVFPSLKYLTLQSFDFYPILQAAKLFPDIAAIHFAYCQVFHLPFIKAIISENRPYWRHLDTIVLRTARDTHAKKVSRILRDLVAQRLQLQVPIKRVLLDKDMLQNLSNVESIRAFTEVTQLHATNFEDPLWIMAQHARDDKF